MLNPQQIQAARSTLGIPQGGTAAPAQALTGSALLDSLKGNTPQTPQQNQPQLDSLGQVVKNTFPATISGVEQIGKGYGQTQEGVKNFDFGKIGRGILNEAAGGLGVVASPITNIFATGSKLPGVKQGLEATNNGVVQPIANYVSNNPHLQDFMKTYPNADEVVSNLIGIGAFLVGGKTAPEIKGALDTGGQAISSGAKSLVDTATKLPGAASDMTTGAIKGIGTKISDTMNPIAPNVETVLKETPTEKLNTYIDLAKKATSDSKAITPLEHAGTKATEALGHIQKDLSSTGELKNAVLNQSSIGRKPVGNIADNFVSDVNDAFSNQTLVSGDAKLVADITAKAKALGPNPLAGDVDRFIDYAQNKLYTSGRDLTVPVTDQVTGTLQNSVGKLNGALKDQLPDAYRNLNARYADLVQTRNELNAKLGPQGERAGSLMKRVFSPSDANTKQLFAKVKQETGIDLTNEAVLAKYVMETSGDARQASLLEQALGRGPAPITKSGLLNTLYEKVKGTVQNPEQNFKKAQRMTVGGETTLATKVPTISVNGKAMTLDDVHNLPASEYKKLPLKDQQAVSKFDMENSRNLNNPTVGQTAQDISTMKLPEQIKTITSNPEKVVLYRGEGSTSSTHAYYTTDQGFAKNFGGKDAKVIQGSLPVGSKVLDTTSDISNLEPEILSAKNAGEAASHHGGQPAYDKAFYDSLFKDGYDAVISTGNRGETQVVVNPKHYGLFK